MISLNASFILTLLQVLQLHYNFPIINLNGVLGPHNNAVPNVTEFQTITRSMAKNGSFKTDCKLGSKQKAHYDSFVIAEGQLGDGVDINMRDSEDDLSSDEITLQPTDGQSRRRRGTDRSITPSTIQDNMSSDDESSDEEQENNADQSRPEPGTSGLSDKQKKFAEWKSDPYFKEFMSQMLDEKLSQIPISQLQGISPSVQGTPRIEQGNSLDRRLVVQDKSKQQVAPDERDLDQVQPVGETNFQLYILQPYRRPASLNKLMIY